MNKMGIGVGIVVFNDKKEILLLLRNSDKDKALSDMRLEGTYTLPSGKVKYGETFEEAGVRKLEDEIGLITTVADLEVISLSNDINDYAHYATVGLIAHNYSGDFRLKKSEEFEDYGFFAINNLPENICMPSLKIIKNYQNKIIYNDKEML